MRSLAKLNDSLLGLNFIFRQEGEGFDYETINSGEIHNGSVQTMITFELSNKQMNYFRQVETVFDLLASLGGFFSALSLICGLFVTAFHFYGSYQFLMDNLFLE